MIRRLTLDWPGTRPVRLLAVSDEAERALEFEANRAALLDVRRRMSRSVRIPTRRPSASATITESPMPPLRMASIQVPSGVPGVTTMGSRRPTTLRDSSTSHGGTRVAVAPPSDVLVFIRVRV